MITDNNKNFLARFGSEKHIDKFINDEEPYVRTNVARNPNLQTHHIDRLLNDEHHQVRASVVGNPNLKPHHIDKLSNDRDSYVRATLARHQRFKLIKLISS